jgi:iron(III) transport system permease protein
MSAESTIPTLAPSSTASPARRFHFGWREVVLALLIVFLAYQVVIPFVMIIWTSLKTARPGDPEFLTLTVTFANYVRALGSSSFWSTTGNTLSFALASTLVAFTMGAFLAWVVERTNTPLGRFIGFVLIARIVIPGVLIVISWILIASPNIGIFNQLMRPITGVRNIVNIYSFWGMVWVQALEMVPLAYLLLSAAFQAMDPRLEEASTMTGAGNWRTLRRISLPLALPAVGAALLLLFVIAIETFEVPLLMGTRAGIRVYTTEIFYDTSRTPIDWGLAATYAMALLAVAIVLLFFYFRLIRHGERYQTITGKDYRPRRIDLGGWKYLTCAVSLLFVFLITGVPFLMMLYASLLPFYQAPSLDGGVRQHVACQLRDAVREHQDGHPDDQFDDPRAGRGNGCDIHRGADRLLREQDPGAGAQAARLPGLCADRDPERGSGRDLLLVLSAGAAAGDRYAHHHRARIPHQIHAGGTALRVGLDDADPQ